MTQVFTGDGILYFRLCARKAAIKLEASGLKRHGRSAYSISKEVYNLRGNRESVINQMENMIIRAQNGTKVADMIKENKEKLK